jgi:hypothetical protein
MAAEKAETMEFNEFVTEFRLKYIRMWWETSTEFPPVGPVFNHRGKLECEKCLDDFIDETIKSLKHFPEDMSAQRKWRDTLGKQARFAGEHAFGLPPRYMDILSGNPFSEVTDQFVRQAREFDPEVKLEDMLQAMRNVWIMNSIQIFLGVKVQHTPSVFAYSMLYPYTDNYLDDPSITLEEKKRISFRFRKCLAGEGIQPENRYERLLYQLVHRIEGQYPRFHYPRVYQSLLGIHDAQVKSLQLQGQPVSPYESDILGISFEKGGMSVLADACLVKGELQKKEAAFMFAFGIFLQLADDLQDAGSDRKSNHMTMFSQTAEKWPLDLITNKLIRFMYRVLDEDPCFTSPHLMELKEVIRYNMLFLIVQAIAQNSRLYTRDYVKQMEEHCRFSFKYLKGLNHRLQKEYASFNRKGASHTADELISRALRV